MRKFIINVNGNSYEVDVEEVKAGSHAQRTSAPVSEPVAPLAPKQAPAPAVVPKKEVAISAGQNLVEAPMPGNIFKILVSEGQDVKSGDVLLILEAMKMENEILAPRDGKVVNISTVVGASVNTGEQLVIIG
ncbi:biotin/lipoyl-binding protein [Tissierella creatinini]|nr:biotin/lipoyl-binding protein [Tissierella creatinini]TJX63725.1 biotin/lipoyl-binding protein [Soehngenia saccharolytica]